MSNIQSLNKDLYDKYDNRYIKRDEYSGGSAENTTYDNTDSGLTSTNVQGAIDELYEMKSSGGLPPRPVTDVIARIIGYKDGTNEFSVSWTKGAVYDVQVEKFNIYGYVGSTEPTSFSQFALITSVSNTSSSLETDASHTYDYILVAPISTDGVVQEDLNQMCKVKEISNMPVKGTTFADMSWSNIKKVADNGLVKSYFNIGDQKTIMVDKTNYLFVIGDFYHDDKSNGTGKAPLTILLKNTLSNTDAMYGKNSNSVGWTSSSIRNNTMSNIAKQMPNEVKSVWSTVFKKTRAANSSDEIQSTYDYLFLLSEVEVFGKTTNSVEGEGYQYPIFTNNNSRIKKQGDSGSEITWWLRSPCNDNSTSYCSVSTNGTIYANSASTSLGLCFGFCI